LIVALDCDRNRAAVITNALQPLDVAFKVNYRLLLDSRGLALIHGMLAMGRRVMLDLKLLDTPDTVMKVVKQAEEMGFWALTVHGHDRKTLNAAIQGRNSPVKLNLLAVTTITSQDRSDIVEGAGEGVQGVASRLGAIAIYRARKAINCGFNGIIVPPWSLAAVKTLTMEYDAGPNFIFATPGMRLAQQLHGPTSKGDHLSTWPPHAAIKEGATHVIVGRPIIDVPDPWVATMDFLKSIASGVDGQETTS
jgi:orotidine-5'-phosphate decarboxylase